MKEKSNSSVYVRLHVVRSIATRILLVLFIAVVGAALGLLIPERRAEALVQRVPMLHDWSMRYTVYPRLGPMEAMQAASRDPRAFFEWRRRGWLGGFGGRDKDRGRRDLQRDWSINLGTGGTAAAMYPAKFTFDVTLAPSCANDFVVFPVNAAGSSSQPNLVAFNNLYSGTAGATGICNRTPTANDTGTAATVMWSYNVQGISGGGAVTTSPVISYDYINPAGPITGSKIAFVESAAGSPAHFHVLAWKSGDGVATNLQNVLLPRTINTFVSAQPATGSGTATDLSLGSSTSGTDTLSSPFVDYLHDVAYVGNDLGTLYRIKDVFCTSNNPDCTVSTKPAPSLDASWGSGGAISVCSGKLTGPILDFVTMNVFVGCSDGKLYSISQSGTIKSVTVGDGVASKTYGAIVDPPVVDGVNGFVYAVSGSAGGGANGVLIQATTALSSSVAVPIGAGNQCNMHAPSFSNVYYTSPTTAGSLIYVGGVTGTVGQPCTASSTTTGVITIYGIGFGAGGVMTSGAPANSFSAGGGPGAEWTPLLEFYNATTATDWLFVAAYQSSQTNLGSANITAGFPAGVGTVVTEGLGPSGMTVDNDSSSAQAASIYFNALGENAACTNNTVLTDTGGCAVKLTQAGLQ
jgi:hypothetical protein